MEAALEGRLSEITPRWRGGASCCVVIASEGYPGSYPAGRLISGIGEAEAQGCRVYCAGVNRLPDGGLVTAGGRVLGVTALADTLGDARRAAYRAVELVSFDGCWMRPDIGISP
jgi:phosphoribosylamine--glycine ligase